MCVPEAGFVLSPPSKSIEYSSFEPKTAFTYILIFYIYTVPSWEVTYPFPAGTFESMIFRYSRLVGYGFVSLLGTWYVNFHVSILEPLQLSSWKVGCNMFHSEWSVVLSQTCGFFTFHTIQVMLFSIQVSISKNCVWLSASFPNIVNININQNAGRFMSFSNLAFSCVFLVFPAASPTKIPKVLKVKCCWTP